ncbi:MAG: hypothetical protein ACI9CA_000526 [Natronomonas sp.]|jgi:hypothetical protein
MRQVDEFFHTPGEERYWSESHYFDATDEDGNIALHGRVGLYPNRSQANVFFYLITEDTVYWVRDETIPPERMHGLVVRDDEWTLAMEPLDPGQEWRVTFEGTVTETPADDPGAVLAGRGDESTLSAGFTVESRHDPFYYSDGETFPDREQFDRYEVATRVDGTATIDGRRTPFSGVGERDHSWGRRRWAGDAEWLWVSGAFEDGTAYNHNTFWLTDHPDGRMINGFWFDGETRHALTDATVSETPAFGPETTRAWMNGESVPDITMELTWNEGTTTIEVDPAVTTPLDWVNRDRDQRAVLNRATTTQRRDGAVSGVGFLENNCQLQLDPGRE